VHHHLHPLVLGGRWGDGARLDGREGAYLVQAQPLVADLLGLGIQRLAHQALRALHLVALLLGERKAAFGQRAHRGPAVLGLVPQTLQLVGGAVVLLLLRDRHCGGHVLGLRLQPLQKVGPGREPAAHQRLVENHLGHGLAAVLLAVLERYRPGLEARHPKPLDVGDLGDLDPMPPGVEERDDL